MDNPETYAKVGSAPSAARPSGAASGGGVSDSTKAGTASPKKSRPLEGSVTVPLYGRRKVKYYPITERELHNIGEKKNIATVLFSISTLCFGSGGCLLKDIIFSDSPKFVNLPIMAQPINKQFDWTPVVIGLLAVGIISFISAIYFTWSGYGLIKQIKGETDFDEK